jgi:hypothetical protein
MERLERVTPEEMPEVLRLASELYARERAEIERATQRLELRKAAAEAGLPPEYLERAAVSLESRRLRGTRRRRRRRALAMVGMGVALWMGARIVGPPSSPAPDEAYINSPYGGGGYGMSGPGGYPGPPGAPMVGNPGYGYPGVAHPAPGYGVPGGPGGPPGGPPSPYGGSLAGSHMPGASFSGANFAGQDFSQANLRGADLTDANLRGADLSGCDLRGADFTGADLAGVELTDAAYDRFTRWPEGFDPDEYGAKRVARGGRE